MVAYLQTARMIFSYLREKKFIKNVKQRELVKVALEGNFVNHVLPSGWSEWYFLPDVAAQTTWGVSG